MKTAEIIWFDVHSNTMTRVGWCVTTFGSPRRQRVRQILAAADCDWVQDYATQRDCTDGKRGCFCAHVAAIAHAFEDDACDVVWMFEDDVAFARPLTSEDIERVEAAARAHDALVAVGGMALSPLTPVVAPDVYRGSWNYTHAYVVPRSCAERIASLAYDGEHYDRVLARSFPQLLVHPALAYQRPSTPSLTSSARIYHMLTAMRNGIGPALLQWLLGVFWIQVGRIVPSRRSNAD